MIGIALVFLAAKQLFVWGVTIPQSLRQRTVGTARKLAGFAQLLDNPQTQPLSFDLLTDT
jgi:hypothetical protein